MKGFQEYLVTVSGNEDIYTHSEVRKFLSPTPFPSDADIVAEKAAPWSADYQRRAERGEGAPSAAVDDEDEDEDEDEDGEEGSGGERERACEAISSLRMRKAVFCLGRKHHRFFCALYWIGAALWSRSLTPCCVSCSYFHCSFIFLFSLGHH
jgi:hypothetical protein